MTLFDRKVDLARFTQDTPLYVMCREWMWNNPSATTQTNGDHSPSVGGDLLNPLTVPMPLSTGGNGKAIRLDIPVVSARDAKEVQQELDRKMLEVRFG